MKNRKINVRASIDDSGAIEFEVDGQKAKHHRLKLDKDSGPHTIEFKLHDQTGMQLGFDRADPIWAGDNIPCPPPQGLNSDQLSVAGCASNTLTVVNANSGSAREVRYQLNFIDGGGAVEACDPIIDNGGGNFA